MRKIKLKPLNPKKLPMFIVPYPNEWATLMAEGFEQHSKAKLWENILEGIRRMSCGKSNFAGATTPAPSTTAI